MKNIKIDDLQKALYGDIYFRFSVDQKLNDDEYFNCLRKIKNLFQDPDFESSIPGFYINFIRGSLRLCYYTIDVKKTRQAKEVFLGKNPEIKIFSSQEPEEAQKLKNCDDNDLRFRNFLTTYSQIGLDLIDCNNFQYIRDLVAGYRFAYICVGRISSRPFFEAAFSKYSNFFNQMNLSMVEQFWKDLDRYDDEGRPDWAHYFVNMLLPYDGLNQVISVFKASSF